MIDEKRPPTRVGEWLRSNATWLFVVVLILQSLVSGVMVSRTNNATEELAGAVDTIEITQANLAVGLIEVRAALDQFEADRIDRSVNACEDRNAIRVSVNRLALPAGGHDANGNPTEAFTSASPENQQRARDFLSNLVPLQVCTTEAIDLYLASDRTEGLVPIDGSDGYSEAVGG